MSTHASAQVRYLTATVATLVLAALLPVLVHLLPAAGGIPVGQRLLPIFYAPLIASFLGQPVVALAAALLAPFLNNLLTGSPAPALLPGVTTQLLVFTVLLMLVARSGRPALALLAPVAYLGAYFAAPLLLALLSGVPGMNGITIAPTRPFGELLAVAWPGLLALALIGLGASRWRKKPEG